MVTLQMDGILSKVSEVGKDVSWLTGAAGFFYGVTYKFRSSNTGPGNSFYPFNQQGIGDTIAQLAGPGAAQTVFPNWSGGAVQTFNPAAIINKFTGYALVVAGLKEFMPNKYTRAAYNIAFAPLLGAGVGRMFDDPPGFGTGGRYTPQPQGPYQSWIGVRGATWR